VNSGSGRISYDGVRPAGEYLLTSHSGDLDVSIPASALFAIKARSIKGESDPSSHCQRFFPAPASNLLLRPGMITAVALRTAFLPRQNPAKAPLTTLRSANGHVETTALAGLGEQGSQVVGSIGSVSDWLST